MTSNPYRNEQGLSVLYSYSHQDEALRDELAKHLSMLQRQGVIQSWYDRRISAGSEWAGQIDKHLNQADIILLLISANFLASDYCYGIELKRAMERHEDENDTARVIPIILKSVDWSGTPFSKLQTLPTDAKPIIGPDWHNPDEAFAQVARGIRQAAIELRSQQQAAATKPLAEADKAPIPSRAIPPNPYQGLFAFREQDANFYFGRESVIQELIKRIDSQSFLAVFGASGSGKSSLVFAGLVPHFRAEKNWLIQHFRPGRDPYYALARALKRLKTNDLDSVDISKLANSLASGETKLSNAIEDILIDESERTQVLLIVDQFEEVFTIGDAQKQASEQPSLHFINQLLSSFTRDQPRLHLVLTVRADFMGAVSDHRLLADALNEERSQYTLGPMSREELRAAIEKPAQKQGVSLEKGLSERILTAVADHEGSLPLLAFALSQLWDQQDMAGILTHKAYNHIGGVEQALAKHAEVTYQKLNKQEQEAAQNIFLQLVYPGTRQEDTGRIATREELNDAWPLVTKLATRDARLLVINRVPAGKEDEPEQLTAEIIHEALIRRWNKLRGWINEHRAFRIWQERLRQDVQLWQNRNQADTTLLRGYRLGEAAQMLAHYSSALNPLEKAFIQASQQLRNREQQAREAQRRQILDAEQKRAEEAEARAQEQQKAAEQYRLLAAQLETQRQIAEQERDRANRQAEIALAQQLAVQGELLIADQQAELGSLLILQSLRYAPTLQGELAWLKARDYYPPARLSMPVAQVKTSNAGPALALQRVGEQDIRLVTVSAGQDAHQSPRQSDVQVWDIPKKSLIAQFVVSDDVEVAAISPEGDLLALAGSGEDVSVFSLTQQGEVARLGKHPRGVQVLVFDEQRRLLTGGIDGLVRIWDLATATEIRTCCRHIDDIVKLSLSPDGQWLATTYWQHQVEEVAWDLWDLEKNTRIAGALWETTALAFNRSSTMFAYVQRVNRKSRVYLRQYSAHRDSDGAGWVDIFSLSLREFVSSIAFSPIGDKLAIAANKIVQVREIRTGRIVATMQHEETVLALQYSEDGHSLATVDNRHVATLWDVDRARMLTTAVDAFQPDHQKAQAKIEALCPYLSRNLSQDEWQRYLAGKPSEQTCPETI